MQHKLTFSPISGFAFPVGNRNHFDDRTGSETIHEAERETWENVSTGVTVEMWPSFRRLPNAFNGEFQISEKSLCRSWASLQIPPIGSFGLLDSRRVKSNVSLRHSDLKEPSLDRTPGKCLNGSRIDFLHPAFHLCKPGFLRTGLPIVFQTLDEETGQGRPVFCIKVHGTFQNFVQRTCHSHVSLQINSPELSYH